ncbi:MAG: hypothetical protein RSB41_03220 [Bacilli bacterium]
MRKIVLLLLPLFLMVGCGKNVKPNDVLSKFENVVKNTSSYTLKADMEIVSNEEKYNYNVSVDYKEGSLYKVSLLNTNNNHEQIILKNKEGVYIITPSLNKSFKFQSDWPNNSSQAYILETLLKDLKNDKSREFKSNDNTYEYTTVVDYPNNNDLKSQKITFNKDYTLSKVIVLNKEGKASITLKVISLDLKAKFNKAYFDLKSNVKDVSQEQSTSVIDDIIYPMYLPSGTTFKGEEKVSTTNSERVILSFTGEKPFIFVEETGIKPKEHEVTNVFGELVSFGPVIGSLTETSINWSNNGMEYYVIGSNLSSNDLLNIASSTSTVALTSKK